MALQDDSGNQQAVEDDELAQLLTERPNKRLRTEDIRNNTNSVDWLPSASCSSHTPSPEPGSDATPCLLFTLPDSLLHVIWSKLDACGLCTLGQTCKYFWIWDKEAGLRLTHKYARDAVCRLVGEERSKRWRGYNWLHKLRIEETHTGFDTKSAEQFIFKQDPVTNAVADIRLEAPGPRMLMSDTSTADAALLRWNLVLRGNNAAEFGVIPADLTASLAPVDQQKALHKSLTNKAGERPVGFHSGITVGSLLSAKLSMMKGSEIEILVTASRVQFLLTNPDKGQEMTWINNTSVSRPYTGPNHMHLTLDYSYKLPAKLALTAWHRTQYDVITGHGPPAQASAWPPLSGKP